MSTFQAIRQRIAAQPAGEVFTPALFSGLGSRASIDQALMRMTKTGSVERIGNGLYTVPRIGRFGIKLMPTPENIAQAMAATDGAIIDIHGAEAARRFGFSTQVPTQPIFNTSGSSRSIRLGNITIRLQHVALRKLVLAGRPSGQALAALWYLGKHQVIPATFKQLATKLAPDEFLALRGARSSMPAWMQDTLLAYERQYG